jgi:hypothetical protein
MPMLFAMPSKLAATMATFKQSIVFKIRTEIVSICHRGIVAREITTSAPTASRSVGSW